MPTTIKLKNGSGAPTAGDLVQGEPALDLTNKRLYTEDAGGNVIEVGTSPSTIDINAGTIDGVTLGTNSAVTEAQIDNINIDGNAITSTDTNGNIAITPDGTGEVDISKVDIDGGTIDDTTIGGSTPAAGSFTTVTGSGDMNIDSGTLFVDASANEVGIGTTDPQGELHIRADTPSLYIQSDDGEACDIIFGDETDQSEGRIRYDSSDNMIFQVNNLQEAMRIDSSGNVGIGTDSPDGKMHLFTGSAGTVTAAAGGDELVLENSATVGMTFLCPNNSAANIVFGDPDDNNIGVIQYGHSTDYMAFTTNASEAMRIDSLGHVTIGRSSRDNATTDNGHNLYGTGEHFLYTSSTNTNNDAIRVYNYLGNITFSVDADGDVKNTNNSYTSLSDQSIKENIVDANSQWDDIKALQIRNYNLIDYPNVTHLGVVAQEVESAGMNGLIKENEDGLKSVKYSILYMKAVKALQEAIARIETLEAEVAALKGA